MVRPYFSILLVLLSLSLFGQTADQIKEIKLKKKGDYRKAESEILLNAKFVLTTPVDPENTTRGQAIQNLAMWMENTPDYRFIIDDAVIPVIQKDTDIMAVYIAGMIKFVLENPDGSKDQNEIMFHAFSDLLDFCSHSENGIMITKEMKRALEARNENKLKEYLKIQ